jgi:hypothetical protein
MAGEPRLWFKRKRYGWGWTPVTGEGWAVIAAYLVGLILISQRLAPGSLAYYGGVAGITLLLIAIGYIKGETPAWRWGKKD